MKLKATLVTQKKNCEVSPSTQIAMTSQVRVLISQNLAWFRVSLLSSRSISFYGRTPLFLCVLEVNIHAEYSQTLEEAFKIVFVSKSS